MFTPASSNIKGKLNFETLHYPWFFTALYLNVWHTWRELGGVNRRSLEGNTAGLDLVPWVGGEDRCTR